MLRYRLLLSLFAAVVLGRAALRRDWDGMRARLGHGRANPGAHVWLHAASNGELASAKPVIEALCAARPDMKLLVTCNSESGVALAQSWGLCARLAPLDLARVSKRFLRRWNVRSHITMESELWPHRLLNCPGPVMVLGGRLNEGTAKGWRLFGGLHTRVLHRVAFLSAQDPDSRERFVAAGLPKAALGPVVDLKALYTPPEQHDPELEAEFARASTWLAASTHEGEDETVLAAHAEARRQEPGLRLILAPRHPRRAEQIARLAAAQGLSCARRSLGETPRGADVYLADTLGEMALFYRLAGRVFVAGTLTDRGGHTPYEPAAFGAALIHGPDVRNFRPPFALLDAAGAALPVEDAAGLAAALLTLGGDAAQQRAGAAARTLLEPEASAAELVKDLTQHMDA
ncbi:3-deoxy-D-manno-octulosonic acid transferase [Salipiger mangrovisoli]|uniref:3-deoxy-D-manno-octulosonic acid transferase n=1 Tax=Salipiger mangrovisoli TaxID=2865933 RepID=A0ABR9WZ85_9RHOB|nr:glycosyltransferase N-terminal domain-containing protein [Salipiger mangrovisoli]MBE9636566.1 3-deoxy-D-manno-octulosonic acid transferase [Salipiger mangrovisoli]